MSTKKEMEILVDASCAKLMEHFECVQILVSRSTPSETQSLFRGKGNWYARQGMAREFITEDESRTAAQEIAEVFEDNDAGESWKK